MLFKKGDSVHYHPMIGKAHTGEVYTIRMFGEVSNEVVYWLHGKSGCVSEDALSPATEVPAETTANKNE